MNSTFLKYFAKGIRNSTNDLKLELEQLLGKKKVQYREEVNSYEFRANFNELLRVCFHSRLMEGLMVQVGNKFEARDERELMQGLQRTPFNNFWKVDELSPPKLTLKVQYSVLPERTVQRLVSDYLEKMPVLKVFNKLQLEAKGVASLSEVQDVIDRQAKVKKERKLLELAHHQGQGTQLENASTDLSVKDEDPNQIRFHMHMEKNFCRFYTPVNRLPMYKHGWKKRVGWGPIKQSLAACILTRSDIIEQAKKKGGLALWDPFCGSGTFLLEAISMLNDLAVRQDISKNFYLGQWPCFKSQFIESYRQAEKTRETTSIPCKIVGSDISLQAINYTIENYRRMNLASSTQQQSELVKKDPASNIFQAANNTYFIAEDFEKVGQELLNLDHQLTVIANLPYGIRSKDTIEKQQLASIYRRFSLFIQANQHKFDNVFVVVPVEDSYNSKHFLAVSKLRWTLLDKYYSGGIRIGLYALRDVASKQTSLAVRSSIQVADKQQLAVPDVDRPVTPTVVTQLPKHLIPKKPRNVRERLLWRRKVHALRLAYQSHMEKSLAMKNIQDFRSNVLRYRLRQRGQNWKKQNLGLLKNSPQEFEQDIRKAFEKRIVTAIERKEQVREKKAERKKKRSGKVARKW